MRIPVLLFLLDLLLVKVVLSSLPKNSSTIKKIDHSDSSIPNQHGSSCLPMKIPTRKRCLWQDLFHFTVARKSFGIQLIGKGMDGEVYRWVRPRDNQILAVKALPAEKWEFRSDFRNEYDMMALFKNKGITANVECYGELWKDALLMMEFLPGTNMKDHAQLYNPQSEDLDKKWVSLCLAQARIVEILHSEGVVHLDLHLGNWIVSSSGRLYLVDFNRARKCTRFFRSKALNGAPEMKKDSYYSTCYSTKSDCWELGNTWGELYSKMLLHEKKSLGIDKIRRHNKGKAQQLLECLLEEEPTSRCSLQEAIRKLEQFQLDLEEQPARSSRLLHLLYQQPEKNLTRV